MAKTKHTPLRIAFQRPWPGTRRGLCLWLFSLAFIFLGGINYIATAVPARTEEALSFAFDIAPPPVWGTMMVTVGVLALWASYCHFGRDKWGFTLLSTFCGGWGLVYICGFLFYDASLRAISGSVIWLVFSGILTLIAGFPNVALGRPTTIRKEDS